MMTDYNRVFFDTAPFIFFLERNPNYYNTVKAFVGAVCNNDVDTVTSTITVEVSTGFLNLWMLYSWLLPV